MNDLIDKKCVPCEAGVLPFDIGEIHKYQKKVDGWDVKKNENNNYFLEKKFTFQNFINSQEFINKVGKISEEEGHHPDIFLDGGMQKLQLLRMQLKGYQRMILFLLQK